MITRLFFLFNVLIIANLAFGQQTKVKRLLSEEKYPFKTRVISKYDTIKINPDGETYLITVDSPGIKFLQFNSPSIKGKVFDWETIELSMGANKGNPAITGMFVGFKNDSDYHLVCQLSYAYNLYNKYILKK